MKKLLIAVAAVVMLAVAMIGADSPAIQRAIPESRSVSELPNEVDLYLPSNPTTGYSWVYEIEDAAVVTLRDEYFADDSLPAEMVGGGGTHWFHISGLKPGTTSVTFRYLRPWEPEDALSVTTYRMTVDDKRNVMIWGVEAG